MMISLRSSSSLPASISSSSISDPKPSSLNPTIQSSQTISESDTKSNSPRKLKSSSRLNRWSRARTVRSGRRLDRRPSPQTPSMDVNSPFQDGDSVLFNSSESEDESESRSAKEIYMVSDGTGWTAEHSVTAALGQFEHCLVDRGCSMDTHLFPGGFEEASEAPGVATQLKG